MNIAPAGKITLCISIAKKPGIFGTTVHNAGYRALGLDFFYQAFKVDNIEGAIAGIRALGIRGCSVSMPYKEKIIRLLDHLDVGAQSVGAVNTIVNDNNQLTGYNTDVISIRNLLKNNISDLDEPVLVLGTGGMARAILRALHDLSMKNIILCGRNTEALAHLSKFFHVTTEAWSSRNTINAGILINATSIGMTPNVNETPIDENRITTFRLIVDVVASPPITKLIQISKRSNVHVIDGLQVALQQAYEQFYLYTGMQPPRCEMQIAAEALYKDVCYG